MTNLNYKRGANLERKVKAYFEERGYKASRSAGSHGTYDVWATNFRSLALVQCKDNMARKEAQKILDNMIEEIRKEIPIVLIPTILYVVWGVAKDKLEGIGTVLLPPKDLELNPIEGVDYTKETE